MSPKVKKKQSNVAPIALIALGAVIVIGVILWAALSQMANRPQNTMADQNIPYPEIQRVSLEDARAAVDQKQAVILDVRGADSFAASHIPGSVNIPLNELETRLSELDPSQWIITYCT